MGPFGRLSKAISRCANLLHQPCTVFFAQAVLSTGILHLSCKKFPSIQLEHCQLPKTGFLGTIAFPNKGPAFLIDVSLSKTPCPLSSREPILLPYVFLRAGFVQW